jgi:signal transduction histidine kinase
MLDIGSRLRRFWPEIILVMVSAANVGAVLLVREWEIVPFHLVWASLALLYGLRVWSVWATAAVLVAVIAVTGLPLLYAVTHGLEPVEELSEVPLISGIFAAMLWHARRYQSAMAEVRRLADNEHVLLERQRDFVRDASHELKTPITVASGHVELILRSSDAQAAADAEVVLDELNRLSRLTERLLLLAATDHREFLSVEPTEIGPFLKIAARRWQAAAERDWRLELRADGVVPMDQERIQLALDALIENAMKFTTAGDRITLSVAQDGGRAAIEVLDTGAGIPPDEQDRVFERFARTDEARARTKGGTGLGLAIVKAVVEAHGGTVSLRSQVGHGAAFRIALPGFEPVPHVAVTRRSLARTPRLSAGRGRERSQRPARPAASQRSDPRL